MNYIASPWTGSFVLFYTYIFLGIKCKFADWVKTVAD